jgi:hypothetical protein
VKPFPPEPSEHLDRDAGCPRIDHLGIGLVGARVEAVQLFGSG